MLREKGPGSMWYKAGTSILRGEKKMDFSKRMRASMLIVIMFCMMCVSTVLAREERIAEAEKEPGADLYVTCESLY